MLRVLKLLHLHLQICMFALYMPLLWMNGRYYMEISKAMEKRIRKKVVEKPTREDPG